MKLSIKKPLFTTKWQALLIILYSLFLLVFGWWGNNFYKSILTNYSSPVSIIKQRPLEKYTIENLSKTEFFTSEIEIDKNMFSFKVDGKKVTGLVNIPEGNGPFPLVLLIRGYVDQSIYTTGTGTKRVGEYLADNGYITLAPDFFGFGGSDSESGNIFESRFQTYTTVLTLLASINTENFPNWDGKNIFIWAHSNGGQIALTVLEVLGTSNPDLIGATVLWAPVSKAFPYSVLYYTDESEDHGKLIRHELSKFEQNYDVDKYSLTNYLDKINAPIELHQGTNDDAIPVDWSDNFVSKMKTLDKDIKYYKHPGADHNMNPLWGVVIQKTHAFFEKQRI